MKTMVRNILLTVCASGFLFLPFSARAESDRYTFDKAHTQILFFVNHLGFSNSQGEFHDYDGYFIFNTDEPEKSEVDVVVKTNSIDMDDEKWDDHLKNKDFFNVEEFPDMRFKSTNIVVTGENTADITGDFTLLGVTKPVTLSVIHNKSGKFPMGDKYVSGFSAKTAIKRSDFGMDYGLPMVSDDVNIMIEVEGERERPADKDLPDE